MNYLQSVVAVGERTRQLVKKWSEEECAKDPSLQLMLALFRDLRADGYSFEAIGAQKKAQVRVTNDPNYVSSAEEEEAIAKAIAESLALSQAQPASQRQQPTRSSTTPSAIYPSQPASSGVDTATKRVVKALYDFEAAEDNELSFKAGELISITDDSDVNWWRGVNSRGDGLFPASFVTPDLGAAITTATNGHSSAEQQNKKSVQFDDRVQVKPIEPESTAAGVAEKEVALNEEELDQCLALLNAADSTGMVADPDELLVLEGVPLH